MATRQDDLTLDVRCHIDTRTNRGGKILDARLRVAADDREQDIMAVPKAANAESMGRYLAQRVQDCPDVVGIWSRQSGNIAELWIQVDTADLESERSIRRLLWELQDKYKDSYIDLQVTNVRTVDEGMRQFLVPEDARRVA
jgi:hypothetical protein